MKLALSSSAPKVDALFVVLEKAAALPSNVKKMLDTATTKAFNAQVKAKQFEGEEGQMLQFYPESGDFAQVIFVGSGEAEKRMPNAAKQLGGAVVKKAKSLKAKKAAVVFPEADLSEFAYGMMLGNYEFNRYKKEDKKAPKLSSFTLVGKDSKSNKMIVQSVNQLTEASKTLRDLVNLPAGDLSTQDLANEAKKIATKYKMKITIFDDKKLKKLGCGAIYGVGQGAKVLPRMVFIEYKHNSKSAKPNIAFVGKGIVFDTGGLNLKPTGYMETMKQDMAGAATVLATMQAIAEAKLSGHYLGVLCCAENAVSEDAQRPGDVVKAYNGKTIEVTNTDAEGRLALADGLSYTEKNFKPKAMVNAATLTGAVSVALGHHITGVMGNNPGLMDDVKAAAMDAQERVWELPLDPDFVKATKGDFTDLKNSTNGVRAGASMGGAFLRNFVKDTPWAHFDIGGTAWAEKPDRLTDYGATGIMLRTFLELARKHQG